MGALIALLVGCTQENAEFSPEVGLIAVGWDPSGPVFSASFWEGPEVASKPGPVVADGCVLAVDEALVDRVPLSAGGLRLTAPGFEVTSLPEALYLTIFYPPPDLDGAPWGGALAVESEGADIPAFSGEMTLPSRVGSVEFGPDPSVRWQPSGAQAVEITVEADTRPGERWWCAATDDGAWAVPSAVKNRLSGPDRLRVQWRVNRENSIETRAGSVRLVGWTGAVGAIDLP